jgi:hypothetical protein
MKRDDLGNYVLSLDETYGWKRPSYQYDQLRARIDRRLRLIANRRGRPVNLYSHNKRDLLEHYAPEEGSEEEAPQTVRHRPVASPTPNFGRWRKRPGGESFLEVRDPERKRRKKKPITRKRPKKTARKSKRKDAKAAYYRIFQRRGLTKRRIDKMWAKDRNRGMLRAAGYGDSRHPPIPAKRRAFSKTTRGKKIPAVLIREPLRKRYSRPKGNRVEIGSYPGSYDDYSLPLYEAYFYHFRPRPLADVVERRSFNDWKMALAWGRAKLHAIGGGGIYNRYYGRGGPRADLSETVR